jgi:hypothetical protein
MVVGAEDLTEVLDGITWQVSIKAAVAHKPLEVQTFQTDRWDRDG